MKQLIFLGLILLIADSVLAQELYLNGSFETPGSGSIPQYWRRDGSISPPNYVREHITTGGAADGTSFVRIRVTSTSTPQSYRGWAPDLSNYQIQPNCHYRLTYSYRRSSTAIDRSIYLFEGGTQAWGNSVFEWGIAEEFDMLQPSENQPVDTWIVRSGELTTRPHGEYMMGWGFMFGAVKPIFIFDPISVGDTFDLDNVILELLEEFKTATCTISTSVPVTYDYTNTDVRIQFLSVAESGDHTVAIIEETPPELGTLPAMAKYWNIDNLSSSFSATPTFFYTNEELSAARFTEDSLCLIRRDGTGPWTEVDSIIDILNNAISTKDPVTSFSTWAITGRAYRSSVNLWERYE